MIDSDSLTVTVIMTVVIFININHVQGPEAGWPLDQDQQTRNILPVITDQSSYYCCWSVVAYPYPTSDHSPYAY